MCEKILRVKPASWTFVRIPQVELTNTTAERAFGTQSEAGSRFVERILTVVMTLRQQERNVKEYLTEACARAMLGNKPPSLLPDCAHEAAA